MAEESHHLSFIEIEQRIFNIRGLQVMPGSERAELVGVETKRQIGMQGFIPGYIFNKKKHHEE